MLAALAARTFFEAFAHENDPDDMAAYLKATFGPELQARELADSTKTYLIAEADVTPVGFALIRDAPPPGSVTGPSPVELGRFYVDRPWQGRGVAQVLMTACLDEGRRRGAKVMWLGVFESNGRAVRFYSRCGFRDVGSHIFMLGLDRQTDRVMVRDLADI